MQIEFIDIEPLPFINMDLEVNGTYPPVVEAFRHKILEADSILFAYPDYNYYLSPPLKNAIDWASRPPNCWANKPAAIISARGGFGGGRSQYHLRQVGVYIDLHFINKPDFFLNAFQLPKKFESDGTLIDPHTKENIKQVLLSLQAFTLRLKRTLERPELSKKELSKKETCKEEEKGEADEEEESELDGEEESRETKSDEEEEKKGEGKPNSMFKKVKERERMKKTSTIYEFENIKKQTRNTKVAEIELDDEPVIDVDDFETPPPHVGKPMSRPHSTKMWSLLDKEKLLLVESFFKKANQM
ncbi:hypothetical protein IFM89_032343 [Coptis chinensis]|uniref:NAD(P)H dehydrogenase (quinone) n=1 Tax=Coptis chinensis TaxID=261450 RepID=A0A835ID96_9MAGN|nr:hypothetical protein IFM89_032343 [Coptis chinensis]